MKTRSRRMPRAGSLLRRHFLAGVLVMIPLAVILWIVAGAVRTLWHFQTYLPQSWQAEQLFMDPWLAFLVKGAFTVAVALALALGISIVGWLSRRVIGQKILEFLADGIIQKIPVVRSIYSALDQLLRTMASGDGQQFNRVVYVEYPRVGMWTLAFVTSESHTRALSGEYLNLFIPTTPNPTSGFYLLVQESEVRDSGLSVEEAFRVILSLGIAQPETGG